MPKILFRQEELSSLQVTISRIVGSVKSSLDNDHIVGSSVKLLGLYSKYQELSFVQRRLCERNYGTGCEGSTALQSVKRLVSPIFDSFSQAQINVLRCNVRKFISDANSSIALSNEYCFCRQYSVVNNLLHKADHLHGAWLRFNPHECEDKTLESDLQGFINSLYLVLSRSTVENPEECNHITPVKSLDMKFRSPVIFEPSIFGSSLVLEYCEAFQAVDCMSATSSTVTFQASVASFSQEQSFEQSTFLETASIESVSSHVHSDGVELSVVHHAIYVPSCPPMIESSKRQSLLFMSPANVRGPDPRFVTCRQVISFPTLTVGQVVQLKLSQAARAVYTTVSHTHMFTPHFSYVSRVLFHVGRQIYQTVDYLHGFTPHLNKHSLALELKK